MAQQSSLHIEVGIRQPPPAIPLLYDRDRVTSGRLTHLYNQNSISIDGMSQLPFLPNVHKLGPGITLWHPQRLWDVQKIPDKVILPLSPGVLHDVHYLGGDIWVVQIPLQSNLSLYLPLEAGEPGQFFRLLLHWQDTYILGLYHLLPVGGCSGLGNGRSAYKKFAARDRSP